MPTPIPAHSALFTARYPIEIDVLKNGHVLNPRFETLAEKLGSAGLDTAAFVAVDHLFKQSQLDQGFNYFQEPDLEPGILYDPADRVVDRVISWLDSRCLNKKEFIWIHFYDPHGPYRPPEQYTRAVEEEGGIKKADWLNYLRQQKNLDPDFFSALPDSMIEGTVDWDGSDAEKSNGEERMVKIIDSYDGEVRFIDSELKRLHDYFNRRGLNRNSLWIITSDHGEGLGNHDWIEHSKYLYNEQLHVPLIFYAPGLINPSVNREISVSLTDIFPTILDLLKIEKTDSDNAVEGISLAPGVLNPASAGPASPRQREEVFAQRREYNYDENPDDLISPRSGYSGQSYCLFNRRYKLIFRSAGEDELFDLINDPGELHNLIGSGLPAENELYRKLTRKVEILGRRATQRFQSVGPAGLQKLKALGYVQ